MTQDKIYSSEPSVEPARTTPEDITARAVASFSATPETRLRTLLEALVRHLHAFAVEVELSEEEVATAVAVLTRTGHISDDRRQEFILWADTLGLSMLVDAISNRDSAGATESTVLGPFYAPNARRRAYGDSIATGSEEGIPAWVHGVVTDTTGVPIAGAEIDVWQNGADRLYAVQRAEGPEDHLRGRFSSRDDGTYAFRAVRPVPYTIPDDGPVGEMLDATRRHPWRPAHIHLIVRAEGYRTLTTHIFDAESDYLDSDAVFAVKPSLVRHFRRRGPDDPERPAGVDGDWVSVENNVVLAAA